MQKERKKNRPALTKADGTLAPFVVVHGVAAQAQKTGHSQRERERQRKRERGRSSWGKEKKIETTEWSA